MFSEDNSTEKVREATEKQEDDIEDKPKKKDVKKSNMRNFSPNRYFLFKFKN